MTVGVLIVSHELLGQAMLDISIKALGICPLATQVLSVPLDEDPDILVNKAEELALKLNSGDGVLVLTDLCGSTPSNIASRLANVNQIEIVAGLNLPMLIRILNYPNLGLNELAKRAVNGGRQGIIHITEQN